MRIAQRSTTPFPARRFLLRRSCQIVGLRRIDLGIVMTRKPISLTQVGLSHA